MVGFIIGGLFERSAIEIQLDFATNESEFMEFQLRIDVIDRDGIVQTISLTDQVRARDGWEDNDYASCALIEYSELFSSISKELQKRGLRKRPLDRL